MATASGSRVKEKEHKERAPVVRELASNRRARHDYHILETLEAGLRLSGTEVKAARNGKVQLKDSFIEVRDGEAWLVGAHISPYSHGNRENHPPERDRKLLLKKRQIDRLFGRTQLKGQTVVPLSVYLKGNWVKVEVALVQGKKQYDKREAIKERELDREAEAAVKTGKW
jgi:SsrA-binding protein